MTVYRRAQLHLRRMLLGTFAAFIFVILWDKYLGQSPIAFAISIVALFFMARDMWRYDCPRCGSNLFMRDWIAYPWPNATCSECGLDLAGEKPAEG